MANIGLGVTLTFWLGLREAKIFLARIEGGKNFFWLGSREAKIHFGSDLFLSSKTCFFEKSEPKT